MGDYIRWSPPYYEGAEETRQARALFLGAQPQQALDPRWTSRTSAGARSLLRLVERADVVLESFRPGVLDRLGVGYERMREVNPGHRLLRDHRLRPGRPATATAPATT